MKECAVIVTIFSLTCRDGGVTREKRVELGILKITGE